MKKFLGWVLVLAMVMGLGLWTGEEGLADSDFTLRSGIMFGDTMEDILKKETKLERTGEDSNEFKGTVAGYSDVTCTFAFDDDEKLKSMEYGFSNACTSRDTMNDVYKKLYDSLYRQYGKPLGNTGGSCHLITGPAITSMSLWVYLVGALPDNDGDYSDYDEWVLDVEDYHVKIDIISYYYRNSDYDYSYFVNLSYLKYTDEDYDNAVDEKRNEQSEVDSDL